MSSTRPATSSADRRQAAADHRRRRLPRLLPGPGGAALERAQRGEPPIRRDRRRQLLPRRAGLARRRLRGNRTARAGRARHRGSRCPTALGDFDYIIHAAAIASPTYYRRTRSRRWTPTSTACATCSTTSARARSRPASPSRASCSSPAARSTATPTPAQHPDARGLPRQRLLHRPARLLRRVQALRRDAVRELRPAARRAGQDGPAVQQLRPGAEDHRRPRDPRLRPRRARRPRHRACSRTARRRGRSATSPTPSPATTRCSSRGRPGEAVQHRRRDAGDLDARAGRDDRRARPTSCSATAGKVVRKASTEADYLVDNPNRRCPVIAKARDGARLRAGGRRSTRACAGR